MRLTLLILAAFVTSSLADWSGNWTRFRADNGPDTSGFQIIITQTGSFIRGDSYLGNIFVRTHTPVSHCLKRV